VVKIIIITSLLFLLSEISLENPLPSPFPMEEDEMLARII